MPHIPLSISLASLLWHCSVTLMVGLFCFAAGRTSGIRDCQADAVLRNQGVLESREYEMKDGIMYRKQP